MKFSWKQLESYDPQKEMLGALEKRVKIEPGPEFRPSPDGRPMKCPTCGFDCSHLREITLLADHDLRRESVELVFDGECGHAWAVTYRQHKGTTFCSSADCGPE